ncbi:hypothetical protein [Brucella pituitosa]|uniref:Uncharacterized protein n=1 Tax=Brucella pituitosa TaxID=571256 RepID=A0A643ETI6_9HYPH|nr:hypothetical protein [Brucella pituitosa]KAB0566120.1 hypothetical protein F7Q93_22010 [Brucella pituitosa]
MRNLTITVNDDWKSALREAASASKAGLANGTYQGETLSFATPQLLLTHFGVRQWAIVHALLLNGSLSDLKLATCDDIDGDTVSDDVEGLVELGVVERDDNGFVFCPFDHIRIDFILER